MVDLKNDLLVLLVHISNWKVVGLLIKRTDSNSSKNHQLKILEMFCKSNNVNSLKKLTWEYTENTEKGIFMSFLEKS